MTVRNNSKSRHRNQWHKKGAVLVLCALVLAGFSGCTGKSEGDLSDLNGMFEENTKGEAAVDTLETVELPEDIRQGSEEVTASATVLFSENSAYVEGEGAVVENGVLSITQSGSYCLRGSFQGRVTVETEKKETVTLYLDGCALRASNAEALQILSGTVELVTTKDSVNLFVSTLSYSTAAEGEEVAEATVFAKDDLTLKGNGSLYVSADGGRGIVCKDDLLLQDGFVYVVADDDGFRGKESLTVKGGTLQVNAGADGLHSGDSDDATVGEIAIAGGSLIVQSEEDGIQAGVSLTIYGGTVTVQSGGGSAENQTQTDGDFGGGMGGGGRPGGDMGGGGRPGGDMGGGGRPGGDMGGMGLWTTPTADTTYTATEDVSRKGLKADGSITVKGGTLTVDAYDDAVHATDVTVKDGSLRLSAGDDGIHADENLNIEGGSLTVTRSYEGLEGRYITLSGGSTQITASDDGTNAVDNSGTENTDIGMGGFGGFGGGMGNISTDCSLTISGGVHILDAAGDGLDSNGNIYQSGGTVIVFGPTNSGNGAIDFGDRQNSYEMTGGTLLAVGASGMAETATGNGVAVIAGNTGSVSADTLLTLQDNEGNTLLTFRTPKAFSHLVFACETLERGDSCTLLSGGELSGDSGESGLLSGNVIGGQKVQTFTAK